jgi:hypothetical protein
MSSWTHEEVAELQQKGNDYALQTWLQNAPPCGQGGRPIKGADVAVYKRFVVECYEHKRYFGEAGNLNITPVGEAPPTVPVATNSAAPKPSKKKNTSKNHSRVASSAPAAPMVDLLDFASETAPGPAASPAPTTAEPFQAEFGIFSSSTTVNAPAQSTGHQDLFPADFGATTVAETGNHLPPVSFDPFSDGCAIVTPSINGSSSGAWATSNNTNSANNDMFADFATLSVAAPSSHQEQVPNAPASAPKKSIMGGHHNASAISMMGGPSLAQPVGGGGVNLKMNSINNGMNLQQQQMKMMQHQGQMPMMTPQQMQQQIREMQMQMQTQQQHGHFNMAQMNQLSMGDNTGISNGSGIYGNAGNKGANSKNIDIDPFAF